MDGIHDLGGMEGFGPVDTHAPPFAHDWERRMWAISKNTAASEGTIDAWRHAIERMRPATYLSIPYFEKWCLNEMAQFVLAGDFTMDEVLSGHPQHREAPPPPTGLDGARARLRANEVDFSRPTDAPPAFAPGDAVRTVAHVSARHTRLPRYARAKAGKVIAHHGAHVFADLAATGVKVPQHLYTVAFAAIELWGETADPRDSITLDLWESYLVPA